LQLGNGGTTGSLSASSAVTDNAGFTFNRSDTLTQGTDFGTIDGSGSVTQAGAGKTILTAANSYLGATTISSGVLQLGNGGATGSLSASSAITNNTTLIFNRSNTLTGVSVTLAGNIITSFDGLMNNGDLFTIILNSGTLTGTFANTGTAAPASAGSTFRFISNGLLWDINYAWTGSTPLANQNLTSFEQTTGGHNVALLLVTVPEPGSLVSLLSCLGALTGFKRFRRRMSC